MAGSDQSDVMKESGAVEHHKDVDVAIHTRLSGGYKL